ncbi:Cellulase-like protein [Mesorhizobium metallidurans STM 2683]|uniref:Cellulase-like protein n=2 Tax=Mesorhizobium metallidurans TaxID=489722 RepID=M5F464_9HYPH|nr:Cellulase-like protein [Mesorhizobium metallidurans STM 2683]
MGALTATTVAFGAFGVAAAQTPAAPEAPAPPAASDRITNPVAEFAGIDKITGRIITFDVYIDETVQFGALQVTPRVCYSRPQDEQPKTDSFVEVDEITLDRKIRRIFTGWMFAESPGLNAVEHAVYDVWLKGCKQKSEVPAPDAAKADTPKSDGAKPDASKTN